MFRNFPWNPAQRTRKGCFFSVFSRFPLLLGLLLALPVAADELTTEYRLENGLKIIVREDHRSPTLVTQVWYKVGSTVEPAGLTGISHVLEHMMFKGTSKVPDGEFSRIVSMYGGEDNAFTTKDYTAYYQVYTADKLALALELEADRMRNLVLKPDSFAQEIRVVMEERRLRTDDKPQALAYERFSTLAHVINPNRTPVIGWMRDLEKMTVEDVQRWYNTWYAPNNATLIVAGDVKPEDVRQLAEKFFAGIPASELPKVEMAREMPDPGDRRLVLRVPAKVPAFYLAYNVPSLQTGNEGDAEALRMLAGIMDEGMSARLETRLVREQGVAAAVNSGYDEFDRGDTLFMITAIPAPGHSMDELEKAILAEIEKLKTEEITQEDMDRVSVGFLAGQVFQRDSVQSQANSIGQMESVGLSWRLQDEWPDRLKKVSTDQVRAAAQKYLVPSRRSIMHMMPVEEKP